MIGGSSPRRGWETFSSPPCPDRLWGLPILLSSGYQGPERGAIPPLPQYALRRGAQRSGTNLPFAFTILTAYPAHQSVCEALCSSRVAGGQ